MDVERTVGGNPNLQDRKVLGEWQASGRILQDFGGHTKLEPVSSVPGMSGNGATGGRYEHRNNNAIVLKKKSGEKLENWKLTILLNLDCKIMAKM